MFQMALQTPQKRPDKAKKSSLTCCCLENHQSDEVHPHASGACPHDVLGKSAVPCLAVGCLAITGNMGTEFLFRFGSS